MGTFTEFGWGLIAGLPWTELVLIFLEMCLFILRGFVIFRGCVINFGEVVWLILDTLFDYLCRCCLNIVWRDWNYYPFREVVWFFCKMLFDIFYDNLLKGILLLFGDVWLFFQRLCDYSVKEVVWLFYWDPVITFWWGCVFICWKGCVMIFERLCNCFLGRLFYYF